MVLGGKKRKASWFRTQPLLIPSPQEIPVGTPTEGPGSPEQKGDFKNGDLTLSGKGSTVKESVL